MRARRTFVASLLAAGLSACTGTAQAEQAPETADREVVWLAVRQDTRPFAWKEMESPTTYRGYLFDICRVAVDRAGYHFEAKPITAKERDVILNGTFKVGEQPIDLLCDPTTITLARLDRFARPEEGAPRAAFTPILFVANGSYVRHASFANRRPCEVGSTPAAGEMPPGCQINEEGRVILPTPKTDERGRVIPPPTCLPAAVPAGEGKPESYFLAGSVADTTAETTIRRAVELNQIGLRAGQRVCLVPLPSHREAIGEFCANRLHLYFGDLDIIQAYRQFEVEGPCDLARAERPLSYEPYALLVTTTKEHFRARFTAAIYEIFSDGTAAGLFNAYFPNHVKSSALSLLFRINSIPGLRPRDEESSDPAPKAPGQPAVDVSEAQPALQTD